MIALLIPTHELYKFYIKFISVSETIIKGVSDTSKTLLLPVNNSLLYTNSPIRMIYTGGTSDTRKYKLED